MLLKNTQCSVLRSSLVINLGCRCLFLNGLKERLPLKSIHYHVMTGSIRWDWKYGNSQLSELWPQQPGKRKFLQGHQRNLFLEKVWICLSYTYASMRDVLGKNSKRWLSLLSSTLARSLHPRDSLHLLWLQVLQCRGGGQPPTGPRSVLLLCSHVRILLTFEFSPFLNCKPQERKGP